MSGTGRLTEAQRAEIRNEALACHYDGVVDVAERIVGEAVAAAYEACLSDVQTTDMRLHDKDYIESKIRSRMTQPRAAALEKMRLAEAEWWMDKLEIENLHPTDMVHARRRLADIRSKIRDAAFSAPSGAKP